MTQPLRAGNRLLKTANVKSSRVFIRLVTTASAVCAVFCAEVGETQAQHTLTSQLPPPFESSFVFDEQTGTAAGGGPMPLTLDSHSPPGWGEPLARGGLPQLRMPSPAATASGPPDGRVKPVALRGGPLNAQREATAGDQQGVVDETAPEVPPVPDFLTQDDLAPLLSRLNELESVTRSLDDGSGVEYLETPSVDSLRVFNGRLHVDEWGFPISSTGINLIENGDPRIAPKNRVLLRRVRLSVAGKVPPQNVSYHLDLEFSGTDRGQVRDAWVGIDDLGRLDTVRIGNQKRPYGLDELNSSNFMVFLERPFAVSAFNEENRRFGVATYGVSDDKRLNWRAGGFHLRQFQNSGSIVDNLNELEVAGRLASTPFYDSCNGGRDYLHCALSGSVGFPSDDPGDTTAKWRTRPEARSGERWLDTNVIGGVRAYELLNVESVLNLGRFQIGGEYMNLWMQRNPDAGPDVFLHGGYVYASYMLTDDFMPWNRDLGILGRLEPSSPFLHDEASQSRGPGAWQVAARFSLADFNDRDVHGGVGKSTTIALNWYLNSHTRLQVNYILGRIDDREITSPGPMTVDGHYQVIGTRIMLDF